MTIQNRDNFLDNLAHHLGRPRRKEKVEKPTWSVSPQLEVYKGYTPDELVNVLEKQCSIIHTVFKRTKPEQLSVTLRESIDELAGQSIIVSDDERNETFKLDHFYEALRQDQIDVHIWDASLGKENQVIAERVDIGITFSDMTLAESGTVALFNDKRHGRTISLLPKTYIAIIPKSTLVPRLTQATKWLHDRNQLGHNVPSCVSFISGPSNSADIEMNLIVGVHGPIKATYIVVDDD